MFPALPRCLTFSTPSGIEGWDGKGITRVWIEGFEERRGVRIGRFLGVIRIVIVNPLRERW